MYHASNMNDADITIAELRTADLLQDTEPVFRSVKGKAAAKADLTGLTITLDADQVTVALNGLADWTVKK